jgi:hypothetical protein
LSVGITTLTVGADVPVAAVAAGALGARFTTVSRFPKCCVPSIAVTQLASPDTNSDERTNALLRFHRNSSSSA